MADAVASISSIKALQVAFQVIQTLELTAWQYPPQCTFSNGSTYDFIVIGGGTAGSIVANRLSANSSISVLLLEAGGYPPIESELPGTFISLVNSSYDYNYIAQNDNYTAQNVQDNCLQLTQAKMLGGCSSFHPMMDTRGSPHDYNGWAEMLGDDTWNYTNLLPYFKKMEKLTDPELLQSSYASLHGTDGNIKKAREPNSKNTKYLEAFKEMGNEILMDSTTLDSNCGYFEPLFTIDDGVRQSSAYAYLSPAKNRSNLCVGLYSTVTKILIKNGVAVGVQVTTSNNETYVVYARKEVILSAGTFNSPKLLMLSGVGPKAHLESLGIPVVADLPVGQNLMDQPIVPMLFVMQESSEVAPATNPHKFPGSAIVGNVAFNSSQTWPDYQTLSLVFSPNSSSLLQMCYFFRMSTDISQKFYEASINKETLFSLVGLTLPKSRGQVLLASRNPGDAPLVYPRIFSNEDDLTLMANAWMDHSKIMNSTYFKSVNATILDLGFCKDAKTEFEFWKCLSVAMSNTMWHFGGTCAMDSVVDTKLRVKGIDLLRVIDSSVMITLTSGKIAAPVGMIGGRGAQFICDDWNIC